MIPIEILLLIFVAFIVIVISAVILGGGKPVIYSLFKKFKKEDIIEKEVNISPAPEVIKFEIEDENGNILKYHGKQDLPNEEVAILDENGRSIKIYKWDEIKIFENIKDVMEEKTLTIRLKAMPNNAYANIMAKIHARDLLIAQKDIEAERISKSANLQRIFQRKQEAEEYRIKYGGRPRIPQSKKDLKNENENRESYDELE